MENISKTCDNSTNFCTTPLQKRALPPTTIFLDESIVLQEYPFEINAEGGFYEDIKDFMWKSKAAPHYSNLEVDSSLDHLKRVVQTDVDSADKESDVNKIVSTDSDPTHHIEATPEKLKFITKNMQNSAKINLKDHLRAKLNQHFKDKEHANKINENRNSLKVTSHNIEPNKINESGNSLQVTSHKIKTQCVCESCDNFINCPAWCRNNLSFDQPNASKNGWPLLKSSVPEKQCSVAKKIEKNLIVLGPHIPKPISSIEGTFFDESIRQCLETSHGPRVKDIQTYMWPAVQRGLNAFMVGPPRSGKTYSYLPAFCSFCCEKDRYVNLEKYGPLIIILCLNDHKCFELEKMARKLLVQCSEEVTVGTLTDEAVMKNDCDILIANPAALEKCLKSGIITLKRLCHLAIEEAHILFRTHHQNIKQLFQLLNTVQLNRPYNKNIQIVVASEKWSMDMDELLKKLHTTPILCFNDFLEAAVYSTLEFKTKKLKTLFKLYYLSDVLKQKFMTHKTVIFCNDDVAKVRDHLEVSGIECIVISDNLSEDEVFENADMWSALHCGYYKVLICSDSSFEKTEKVVNAEWLFHYSLPSGRNVLQKRFKCLSANLFSIKAGDDTPYEAPPCYSFMIMDELGDNNLYLSFFEDWTRNSARYLQM